MPSPTETRDAILRSAREVFADSGYRGASLRKIASRAGVTHAAIYRHFADKDDLLAALAEHDFEELVREVGNRIDAAQPPLDRLRALLLGFVTVCTENPCLYEFLFQILPGLPHRPSRSAEIAHDSVVQVVSECLASGALEGDPEHVSDLVLTAAHGLVARTLARRAAGLPVLDADDFVAFVLSGVGTGAVL